MNKTATNKQSHTLQAAGAKDYKGGMLLLLYLDTSMELFPCHAELLAAASCVQRSRRPTLPQPTASVYTHTNTATPFADIPSFNHIAIISMVKCSE